MPDVNAQLHRRRTDEDVERVLRVAEVQLDLPSLLAAHLPGVFLRLHRHCFAQGQSVDLPEIVRLQAPPLQRGAAGRPRADPQRAETVDGAAFGAVPVLPGGVRLQGDDLWVDHPQVIAPPSVAGHRVSDEETRPRIAQLSHHPLHQL